MDTIIPSHKDLIVERVYDFEGAVYCISVPNEVFYVRRDGKPVWTGNSRSSGPVVQLTRQPAEGRSRDGGLRVGKFHFANKRGLLLCEVICPLVTYFTDLDESLCVLLQELELT